MPARVYVLPLLLSVSLFAVIQFKFISQIDGLIMSNKDFSEAINAGIASQSKGSEKVIQLQNLNKINERQIRVFESFKIGAYIGAFFILISGLYGAYIGYSSRMNEEDESSSS